MRRWAVPVLAFAAYGCGSSANPAEETSRLVFFFDQHRKTYLEAIDTENRLRAETLGWLASGIENRHRTQLRREALDYTERWAKAYFRYRDLHTALAAEKFSAEPARSIQSRILARWKERYFVLHDFQRYAQHTSESDFRDAPLGRMPPQLAQFQARLRGYSPAPSDITQGESHLR